MSRYQRENVVQGKNQTPEGRLWSLENSRPLEGKKIEWSGKQNTILQVEGYVIKSPGTVNWVSTLN